MSNLSRDLRSSVVWSTIERFSSQLIQFVVSIIIARLLVPSDYGIIAMTAIFIGVSQAFIDSGFSTALIRKQDRTQIDNSTIFYFNILIGAICYWTLWISAPLIAKFYNQPILIQVVRVLTLSILINAFQIVPRAILTSNADFKRQTIASLPATFLSGFIGVWMAYQGYGVWALVIQQLCSGGINSILLCVMSKWRPSMVFSLNSIKELFPFSSKLLISGLIDTIWNNSYTLVIGKFFEAKQLGLYSRAYTLGYFPSVNLASTLQRGFFPVLCKLQDNDLELVNLYRKFLKLSVYVVAPIMMGIAAISAPLINIILTPKWSGCIIYLQILCFYFILKPIVSINNNIYQVKGRSDIFLHLEIYKKIISLFFLIVSIPFGVIGMCVASVISECICTILNMFLASRIIPLTISQQIKDILPTLLISIVMLVLVQFSISFMSGDLLKLVAGTLLGICFYISCGLLFKQPEMFLLWQQLTKLHRK